MNFFGIVKRDNLNNFSEIFQLRAMIYHLGLGNISKYEENTKGAFEKSWELLLAPLNITGSRMKECSSQYSKRLVRKIHIAIDS